MFQAWPGAYAVPMHMLWTCVPMSTKWTLLASHDVSNGQYFSYGTLSVGEPGSDTFMEMSDIDSYRYFSRIPRDNKSLCHLPVLHRSCDDRFHFRLVYPDLGFYNDWWQRSNPTTDEEVLAYQRKSQWTFGRKWR